MLYIQDIRIVLYQTDMVYSSSFDFRPFEPPASRSSGRQSAGLVPVNRYSHFSGSETERSAFSVPQEKATLTLRSGPFQQRAPFV